MILRKCPMFRSMFRSKASSIPQMQARVVAFRGSCYNMNGIIKYSLSQRKIENGLAPQQDDATLPMWFLQTNVMLLPGCLSDPLLTNWPLSTKLCGKAEFFKKIEVTASLVCTEARKTETFALCKGNEAMWVWQLDRQCTQNGQLSKTDAVWG